MQSSSFRSIILDKTPCLLAKKLSQSERQIYLLIAEEFEGGTSSYTRDFTEWKKIRSLEENVAQISSKHNKC